MIQPADRRKIRVLIADDHALVRSGLRSILETEPEIEVVGEAGDGHEALAVAQELLPDVILMDIKMGDWDGVTATRRVRNSVPSSRVIVLTHYAPNRPQAALYGHTRGLLEKDPIREHPLRVECRRGRHRDRRDDLSAVQRASRDRRARPSRPADHLGDDRC